MDGNTADLIHEEHKRIAKILHDRICQELTIMTFMTYELERKLAAKSLAEAQDAAKLSAANQKVILEIQNLMKDLNHHA